MVTNFLALPTAIHGIPEIKVVDIRLIGLGLIRKNKTTIQGTNIRVRVLDGKVLSSNR